MSKKSKFSTRIRKSIEAQRIENLEQRVKELEERVTEVGGDWSEPYVAPYPYPWPYRPWPQQPSPHWQVDNTARWPTTFSWPTTQQQQSWQQAARF